MPPTISIIIPTFNNPQFLNPCVNSVIMTGVLSGLGELIIVNNGKQPVHEEFGRISGIKVLEPGENLGWEKGLEYGLKQSSAPFVCFQNDDTHIPAANEDFYKQLLYPFHNRNVGAVGPSTTISAGWHSIFNKTPILKPTEVSYLIFFTVMIRRSALDAVGGIDTSCPGGDDFDLSMRLRKAGNNLVLNPKAFIIHHAFKTGERVHGGPSTAGGWNSQEMSDRTNAWLIKKHGFKAFMETRSGLQYAPSTIPEDKEGRVVRQFVDGESIVEFGCGFRKTVDNAIGVDWVSAGEEIPHVLGGSSVADIQADVSKPLPFNSLSKDTVIARHILEHCLDPVETLKNWNRIIKIGGRLVIAVPNHAQLNTIPLNPEHCHGYTPDSLKNLLELVGFKQIAWQDPENGFSFVGCFEKVLHMDAHINGIMMELTNA